MQIHKQWIIFQNLWETQLNHKYNHLLVLVISFNLISHHQEKEAWRWRLLQCQKIILVTMLMNIPIQILTKFQHKAHLKFLNLKIESKMQIINFCKIHLNKMILIISKTYVVLLLVIKISWNYLLRAWQIVIKPLISSQHSSALQLLWWYLHLISPWII